MTIWQRIWLTWAVSLALLIVMFLIVEGIALARPAFGDTLTESVVGLREANSWVYWLIIDVVTVAGVTMCWLVWHLRFWER